MEGAIPPVPADRVVPQPRARDGTNKHDREREKTTREFVLPGDKPAEAEPAPAPETPAHPPSEEGIGGRLDITA